MAVRKMKELREWMENFPDHGQLYLVTEIAPDFTAGDSIAYLAVVDGKLESMLPLDNQKPAIPFELTPSPFHRI